MLFMLKHFLHLFRFIAFGVGLDPRQAQAFGPRIGPLLVACALGLTSFATSGLIEGYTGAGMNPSSCFAFSIARVSFKGMLYGSIWEGSIWEGSILEGSICLNGFLGHWVWWVGPLAGGTLQCLIYSIAPPYHCLDTDEPNETRDQCFISQQPDSDKRQ